MTQNPTQHTTQSTAQNTTSEQSRAARERTYSWADPQVFATAARELDGLDFFKQLGDSELPPPPINATLGMTLVEVSDGRAVFELTPEEWHYNPIGTVHGGIISTLLDTAAACSVQSTLPLGVGYTSMDLNVKFLRAVTTDSGTLTCTGSVLQSGRRTALAEARLTDAQGRLVAHATSSCLIFPLPQP